LILAVKTLIWSNKFVIRSGLTAQAIARANVKNPNGFNAQACSKLPIAIEPIDLVVPQAGHGRPVASLIGQNMGPSENPFVWAEKIRMAKKLANEKTILIVLFAKSNFNIRARLNWIVSM
jgi:hypothetical protein